MIAEIAVAMLAQFQPELHPFVTERLYRAALMEQRGDWVDLFDGKSLEGWKQHNGTATYRVENGAIVGRTSEGSPNSFLCSSRVFGDFELEFEVRVDPRLNSGVQIRSRAATAEDRSAPLGRVWGPQIEIEAGPGFAGYVFGEATPFGWLSPEPGAGRRHGHFVNDGWNKYRVLAIGPRIRTWVNGRPIADVSHEGVWMSHKTGFIGLQVHSIPSGQGPFEVAWRNIRVRPLGAQPGL